jgi:RES domain-containing protein
MPPSLDAPILRAVESWMTLCESLANGRGVPNQRFLDSILEGTDHYLFEAATGWDFYRARLHYLEKEGAAEPLAPAEIGPPPASAVKRGGRMNGREEVVFYGARDVETAISEVRPWKRARISVGTFRTTRPLRIVDLSDERISGSVSPELQWVSYVISRPVHPDDEVSYAGSQHLCREWLERGIDGVFYDSALQERGVNVVLFDSSAVSFSTSSLWEVTGVQYQSVRLSD